MALVAPTRLDDDEAWGGALLLSAGLQSLAACADELEKMRLLLDEFFGVKRKRG